MLGARLRGREEQTASQGQPWPCRSRDARRPAREASLREIYFPGKTRCSAAAEGRRRAGRRGRSGRGHAGRKHT